eukprot:COSAG05_NODE_11_length_38500_cov_831.349861_20_plen_184_part_00
MTPNIYIIGRGIEKTSRPARHPAPRHPPTHQVSPAVITVERDTSNNKRRRRVAVTDGGWRRGRCNGQRKRPLGCSIVQYTFLLILILSSAGVPPSIIQPWSGRHARIVLDSGFTPMLHSRWRGGRPFVGATWPTLLHSQSDGFAQVHHGMVPACRHHHCFSGLLDAARKACVCHAARQQRTHV